MAKMPFRSHRPVELGSVRGVETPVARRSKVQW